MEKAVVIFSGGQDSTTCLYWAKKNYDEVHAITFAYGQRHEVELRCAKEICEKENVPHVVVDMQFLGTLVDSALINGGDVNRILDNGLPASFVPNRNQLFITLAHAYAQKIGANFLVGGMCETDFSGYPDCRRDFIDTLIAASNKGSGARIVMHTPLMQLNKAQTFELASRLGVLDKVVMLSHTCYNGDREHLHAWGYGCDNCPACELRKKGFASYLETRGMS